MLKFSGDDVTEWSISYTDGLPDSNFLWIESGGKKDTEGKTVPRSLRHLPYRDVSGNIDKSHLNDSKVQLNQLNMSASVKEQVITTVSKLQEGTVSVSLSPTIMKSIAIKEKDGKKIAVISGELMNTKRNSNDWGIDKKDAVVIANEFKDISIRTLHADSEFSIIGTGDSATANDDGSISYTLTVYNPEAVAKFENKEWNERNMGISPQVRYQNAKCSICGQDLLSALDNGLKLGKSHSGRITDFGCGHEFGKTYDNKVSYRMPISPSLVEATLTSQAAYKIAGSGNISNVDVMTASINDLCSIHQPSIKVDQIKRGEKGMEDAKTMLAEKSSEIEVLKGELASMKTKSDEALVAETKLAKETLEAEKAKLSDALKATEDTKKEITDLKASIEKATKEAKEKDVFIAKVVMQTRETELAKVIPDKELIAKILSVEMTDEQFKAKVEEVTAIKKLSASDETVDASSPLEGSTTGADYEKFFGVSQADHEKELFGSFDVMKIDK